MQASLEPLGELTGFGTSAAEFAAEGDQPVLEKSNIVQQPRIDVYDITINGNKLIYARPFERSMYSSMECTLQVSNIN